MTRDDDASARFRRLNPEELLAEEGGAAVLMTYVLWPHLFPGMSPQEAVAALADHFLSHYERRLDDLGVLVDLTPQHRRRLADMVLIQSTLYASEPGRNERERHLRFDVKRGAGQIRQLHRKLDRARQALADLHTYAKSIRQQGNEHLARGLDHWFLPYVEKAMAALSSGATDAVRQMRARGEEPSPDLTLKALHEIFLPDPDEQTKAEHVPGALFDHKAVATKNLFTFFVSQCGLGRRQADRRTALIGNEFWNWNVVIDDEYDEYIFGGAGASGSSAIRKRRTRSSKRAAKRR